MLTSPFHSNSIPITRAVATRMFRTATRMVPPSASHIPSLGILYKLNKLGASRLGPIDGASPLHNNRVGLIRGDITSLPVDAIVNAANTSLLGGGGVDGASKLFRYFSVSPHGHSEYLLTSIVHRGAGPELLTECRTLHGCETGASKITGAYRLPCKKVIHTVGPVYDDLHPGRSEAALRGCYQSSLRLAVENGLKTIAFSGISTGVYGYPSNDAALIAAMTVKTFLDGQDGQKLDKVIFVTFEQKDVDAYNNILPRVFPPSSDGTDGPKNTCIEKLTAEAEEKMNQLPSVPTTHPSESGYSQKRQRKSSTE